MLKRGLLLLVTLLVAATTVPAAAATDDTTTQLRYGGQEVRLVRTGDYGIPHVYARRLGGLFFGSGYATAQDRLWQAEVYRRSGAGTLAELLGPSAAAADREVRRDGYTAAEYEQLWQQLPDNLKTVITGYVAGINAYLAEAKANPAELMPAEFFEAGFPDRPDFPATWTEIDVLQGIVFFVRRFGETGGADLANADLLQTFGTAVFEDLRWLDDPGSYPTNPGAAWHSPRTPDRASWDGPDVRQVSDRVEAARSRFTTSLQRLAVPHKGGSNAWVVAPWKAQGPATRLLGGPQMGYTVPQITMELGLHGAGFDTQGMTFAGVAPFPLIGRGEHHAWTSTTGVGDTIDHVIEFLAPDQIDSGATPENLATPLRYFHDGEWLETDVRLEVVEVAGGDPVEFFVHRTVHGPVVGLDASVDTPYGGGIAVAAQRVHWMREPDTIEAFYGFNVADDVDEFAASARKIWTNHNFLYNDDRGTIGYWMAGRKPIWPEGLDTRLPRLGDGSQEWQGFEEIVPLTGVTNPKQGYLVNWNNKPAPGWDNGDSGAAFGPTHRVKVLADALRRERSVSFADMRRINVIGGTVDIDAYFFRPQLLRALRVVGVEQGSRLATAATLLRQWDSGRHDRDQDGYYDDAGLTVFAAWYDAMLERLFGHVDYTDLGDPPPPTGSDAVLWRLFKEDRDHRGQPALPVHADWLAGRDVDDVAVEVLAGVVNDHEGDLESWLTPVRTTTYRPLGALPEVSHRYLNRGTYNQIVTFTPWASRSVNVNPPGQSGFVSPTTGPSEHWRDQLDLYANWQYKPQILDPLRRRPAGQ